MHAPPTETSDRPVIDYAAPPGVSPNYKWWVVVMLWFVCFLNNGDRQAISAILPKLQDEFHFSNAQLGLIGSAFMWVYAANSPIAGYLGDKLRRKDLILGGCFFWSLVAAATGLCSRVWQFVVVRGLEGFGETFYFPASMSLVSDYHGKETRSKAMSFHQSSVYIGNIVGSTVTATMAMKYGWRSGFFMFGALGMILSVVLYKFIIEPRRGQSDQPAAKPQSVIDTEPAPDAELERPTDAVQVLPYETPSPKISSWIGKWSVWLLFLTFLGANFVSAIFLVWTPTYLVRKFNFNLASAGLSGTAFIYLACAVGAPTGGIMADFLRRRFTGGRMMVQAAGLTIGAAFVFLIGATNSVATLLTAMAIFGFGKGLYDSNIFASLYEAIDPSARATAAGFMNTTGWIGGALGPLWVGLFTQYGGGTPVQNMSKAIATTGAIYVLGAIMLSLVAFVFIHRDSTTIEVAPATS
jgi:MFS family permease